MTKVGDVVGDLLDKVSSPASRAGSTIERVGKMLERNVSPRAIAIQLTDNNSNGNVYTEQGVVQMGQLYQDCKTKVGVTKDQTTGLMEDQAEWGDSPLPA